MMKCILLNQSRILVLFFFYFSFISSLFTDYCSSTTEIPVTWADTTETGAAAIHLNLCDTDEINGMIVFGMIVTFQPSIDILAIETPLAIDFFNLGAIIYVRKMAVF